MKMVNAPSIEIVLDILLNTPIEWHTDAGFSSSAGQIVTYRLFISLSVPVVGYLFSRIKCVSICSIKLEFILIDTILKVNVEINLRRSSGTEVQYLLGATRTSQVILKPSGTDGVQEVENADEIGFSGAIRANQDIDRPELKIPYGCDTLETFYRYAVQHYSSLIGVEAPPGQISFWTRDGAEGQLQELSFGAHGDGAVGELDLAAADEHTPVLREYASAGADFDFERHWLQKLGIRFRGDAPSLHIYT